MRECVTVHVSESVCACVFIYSHIQICIMRTLCVREFVCESLCECVSVCVCVKESVCLYIYTYKRASSPPCVCKSLCVRVYVCM